MNTWLILFHVSSHSFHCPPPSWFWHRSQIQLGFTHSTLWGLILCLSVVSSSRSMVMWEQAQDVESDTQVCSKLCHKLAMIQEKPSSWNMELMSPRVIERRWHTWSTYLCLPSPPASCSTHESSSLGLTSIQSWSSDLAACPSQQVPSLLRM